MSNNYGQFERSLFDNEEDKFAQALSDLKYLVCHKRRDGRLPAIPGKGAKGDHSEIGIKNQWADRILDYVRDDLGVMADLIWDAIEERIR